VGDDAVQGGAMLGTPSTPRLPLPTPQGWQGRRDLFRNGREFTDRFPGIRDAVLTLPCRSAIIDGEVVVCNEDGTPNFRRIHFRRYADHTLCV
jgi:hypothetical protein